MTDEQLRDLPIELRNRYLDALAEEAEEQQARLDWEAERRTERWYEERGGSTYAGSFEEQQDRYLDGLVY